MTFLGETLSPPMVRTYRTKAINVALAATPISSGSVGAVIGAAVSNQKNNKGAAAGAIIGSTIGSMIVAPNLTAYRCGNTSSHPADQNDQVPAHNPKFSDFVILAAGIAIPGALGMMLGRHLNRKGAPGNGAAIGALVGATLISGLGDSSMLGLECGTWRSSP